MSSDNFHTIRQDKGDGLWYLYHGSMSNLQDGFPATAKAHLEGFESWDAAFDFYRDQPTDFMQTFYSEYGLIREPEAAELEATRGAFFARYPEALEEEWAVEFLRQSEEEKAQDAQATGVDVPTTGATTLEEHSPGDVPEPLPAAAEATPLETTIHVLEITDPAQIEALRGPSESNHEGEESFAEGVPIRAAVVTFTTLDNRGRLVLGMNAPGYNIWVKEAESFEELFGELGPLPVSLPWSQAPLWIVDEYLERDVSPSGLGENTLTVTTGETAAITLL